MGVGVGYGILPLHVSSYPRHKKEHTLSQHNTTFMESNSNRLPQVNTSALIYQKNLTRDVNRKLKKANQTLGYLRTIIKIKPQSVISVAYHTLVRLKLEYGSKVWSTDTKIKIHVY
jgi:hypothetical protein